MARDAPAVSWAVQAGAAAELDALLQDVHRGQHPAMHDEVRHAVQQRLRLAHHLGLLLFIRRILHRGDGLFSKCCF